MSSQASKQCRESTSEQPRRDFVMTEVQQLDVEIETKTEDNVFVQMVVAVQYYVLPEKVYDAFYMQRASGNRCLIFYHDVSSLQPVKRNAECLRTRSL